jgi:hypothetical protein
VVDSYNLQDPAMRQQQEAASQFGHSLADSTALSQAGWQNVTPGMREDFTLNGIPQAPASELAAQRGGAAPAAPFSWQNMAGSLAGMGANVASGLQAYQPAAISQFNAPDQSALNSSMGALVQRLLANPQTMGPDVVNAMKEKEKEQALSMQEQMLGSLQQRGAATGMLNSGQNTAQEQSARESMISRLTGAYRDLDLAAVKQNRQDELGALGAGMDFTGNQLAQALQGYGATLQGQQAQADENRAGNDSQFRNAGFQYDMQQGDRDYGLRSNHQSFTQDLANKEFQDNMRRFDLTFGEGQRQFNSGQQFNWANMANNNQNALIRYLLGGA